MIYQGSGTVTMTTQNNVVYRKRGSVVVFSGGEFIVITSKQAAIDIIKSMPFFNKAAPKPEE